jgi:hypothetical protein
LVRSTAEAETYTNKVYSLGVTIKNLLRVLEY